MRDTIVACVQLCKEAGGSCTVPSSLWHVLRGALVRGIITKEEERACEDWFLNTMTEADQWIFLKSI